MMNNEKFLRYKKRSRWLLLGGIILVLVSPALLTHPVLYTWLSLFDKSGNIGSAIGGITSPFVSLIGAILVYLSFEQQIEANHIQKKALKKEIIQDRIKNQYDTLDKHLSEIKEEFYQLRYKRHFTVSQVNHAEKGQSYGGEEALEAYSADVEKFGDLVHQDTIEFEYGIKYLILLILTFDEQLEKAIIHREQKKYLSKKFLYFYEAKMRFQIELINKNTQAIEDERIRFAQINDDSTEMITQINELQNKYKAELQ